MGGRGIPFLAATVLVTVTASAAAANDPKAGCGTLVGEAEFEAAGSKLVVRSAPDLAHFPPKFLDNCAGNIEYHAIVHEDGSVRVEGKDHGVTCGSDNQSMDAGFHSMAWHDWVIGHRFDTLRYAPPLMANKPVCVTIERGWIPSAPHRFWSPEEWAHHK